MAENLPKSIGKYAVNGIAGRGAQGVVYRAHDPFVDRAVAIKVWSSAPGEGADEEQLRHMRKMFFNEAQAAGGLDHPNILRVYDAGEADGEPYIVMEYVEDSHNLRQHCNRSAQLAVEQVAAYVRDCALALEHAHANGVVHRDIKPANIMLNSAGDVKIVDFGIADRQRAGVTPVKSSCGSPRYMSPEQARGDKVGSQSDLYSLGTVLFELLAGVPPFQRKGIRSLLSAIAYEDPTDIRSLRPDLPELLIDVVNKALLKSTAERYQDGGSFAADLAAVFEDPAHEVDDEPSEERKFQMLRPLSFLEPFTDDELWEFIEVGEWCKFRTGEEIVVEEDVHGALYILISGRVGVSRGATVLDEINAGECLGEIGYVLDEPRVSTITAVKSSVALRIDEPVTDWASFTCQLKFSKQIQRVLATRLSSSSRKAAEARGA